MKLNVLNLSRHLFAAALCLWSSTGFAASPQTPEDVVAAMFDAFNNHDVDALVSLYAETAVLNGPEYCQPKKGKDAVREIYAGLFQVIPDVHDAVQTMVISGDKVAVEFIATGHMGEHEIRLPIAAFLTVQNGLITSDTAYFDTGVERKC